MTYLKDIHGLIIGGLQNFVIDECVHDYNGNLIQLVEKLPEKREAYVGIMRSHGAHKIASFLREQGADVEAIDYAYCWRLEELKDLWKSRYHSKTFFLCISTVFKQSSFHLWSFVDWVRDKYPHIHIIGGTQSVDKLLPYNLDWYMYGYGEYGMLELLSYLKNGKKGDLKYYKVGKRNIINAQKHYPAFPKKDLGISYEDRDFIKPWEVLPTEWARGCIFQCAFCSYPILGVREDHSRDPEDLKKELVENYEKWGVKHYLLADETVNDYHPKLQKYADVIKTLPFQPLFGGYCRADLIAGRKKSWETYIELGFMSHFYGIESLHHPAAKSIGKGMEVGRLKDGLLEFKEYGFKNNKDGFYAGYISLIAGLPNETAKTLDEGNEWLKNHWQDGFCAIGTLSLNLPIYQGEYEHIAYELANLSLIEKDPGKYGYKIMGEMDKKGLWQTDTISHKYFNKALEINTPKGKEDEVPKRVPMRWINNVGFDIDDAQNWIKKNGTILANGTVPTWMFSEYLFDPQLEWVDMMGKSDKKYRLNLADIESPRPDTTGEELKKKTSDYYKNVKELEMNKRQLPVSRNISLPEIDGVQFTSASVNMTLDIKARKSHIIMKYKRDKINA